MLMISTATQCNAVHLKLKLMQHCNAAVAAMLEIGALQLIAMLMQWSFNKTVDLESFEVTEIE